MARALGHADRRTPFRSYCMGLILPGERKSVAPIAARLEPRRVQGAHQSLPHFVANADWPLGDFLRRVRTFVLPAIEKRGRISAWIVDDTGFSKKGVHSVGVARQYCGQLGKQDNCQVAVSLSAANEHASLPIAFRLYLPEDWAADQFAGPEPALPRVRRRRRLGRQRLGKSMDRQRTEGSPPMDTIPRAATLYSAGSAGIRTMKQSFASAAGLRGGGPILRTAWKPGGSRVWLAPVRDRAAAFPKGQPALRA